MEAIKSGFNSTVYRLDNGLIEHKFDSENEGEYRFLYRCLADDLGVKTPFIVSRGSEENFSLVSEQASGEQLSESPDLLGDEVIKEEYWDIVNTLHDFEVNMAGRQMERTLEEYIRDRFSKIESTADPSLSDDDIVYCHRDLNPSNLFFDNEERALQAIDFGSALFGPRHYDLAIHVNFADRYDLGDYKEFYKHSVDDDLLNTWRVYDAERTIQWAKQQMNDDLKHVISENKELLEKISDDN